MYPRYHLLLTYAFIFISTLSNIEHQTINGTSSHVDPPTDTNINATLGSNGTTAQMFNFPSTLRICFQGSLPRVLDLCLNLSRVKISTPEKEAA